MPCGIDYEQIKIRFVGSQARKGCAFCLEFGIYRGIKMFSLHRIQVIKSFAVALADCLFDAV